MKTIRNSALFAELKQKPEWKTLFSGPSYDPELKDNRIPGLTGGLDHIDVKKKGVYFHDIGSNGGDNSFVIRPE